MRLQFDPEIVGWFETWLGEFEWDQGNIDKNEKHGVTSSQIEEIFQFPVYVAGKIMESEEEPRWLLLSERISKGWP